MEYLADIVDTAHILYCNRYTLYLATLKKKIDEISINLIKKKVDKVIVLSLMKKKNQIASFFVDFER